MLYINIPGFRKRVAPLPLLSSHACCVVFATSASVSTAAGRRRSRRAFVHAFDRIQVRTQFRRGVELIRHRGDVDQAKLLEAWLTVVLDQCRENILAFEVDAAQVWGRLRVPDPGHELDKQIAAIALVNDLVLVTRNATDFQGTGVRLVNPFLPATGEC